MCCATERLLYFHVSRWYSYKERAHKPGVTFQSNNARRKSSAKLQVTTCLKLSSAYGLHVFDERSNLAAVYKASGRDSWLHARPYIQTMYIVRSMVAFALQDNGRRTGSIVATARALHTIFSANRRPRYPYHTLRLGKAATQVTALSCTLVGWNTDNTSQKRNHLRQGDPITTGHGTRGISDERPSQLVRCRQITATEAAGRRNHSLKPNIANTFAPDNRHRNAAPIRPPKAPPLCE